MKEEKDTVTHGQAQAQGEKAEGKNTTTAGMDTYII